MFERIPWRPLNFDVLGVRCECDCQVVVHTSRTSNCMLPWSTRERATGYIKEMDAYTEERRNITYQTGRRNVQEKSGRRFIHVNYCYQLIHPYF